MINENENIFNLFNDQTKKVLMTCQKIAREMRASTGTDHLLLALLTTPNTASQKILQAHLNHLKNIKFVLRLDNFKEEKTNKNITKELENILKLAIDHSIQNQKDKINPEDLLWSIINYQNCSAYKILKKLNINAQSIGYEINNYSGKNNKTDINFEMLHPNSQIPPIEDWQKPDFIPQDPSFLFENPAISFGPNPKTKSSSSLEQFGTNLTDAAKKNKLDIVIGREKEINRLMQILCRRTKNNPVLVGEPGVGKTAIVEGLAQKIAKEEIPIKLMDKEIIRLDLALTVAGTMYRGQFESRIKKILEETQKNPKIILFIDEIHTVIGTGSAEGSMDTANILKPSLSKGDIRLIGTTTSEEYRKYIEKDAALERRLQKIKVEEPTYNESLKILQGLRETLEDFHHVKITDEALTAAVKLSSRYINDRYLPDKAIDLVDEAAAATNLDTNNIKKQKIISVVKKMQDIVAKKEEAIEKEDFAQAAYLRSRELKLKQDLAVLKNKERFIHDKYIITENEIAKVVSNWTQIPYDNLVKEDLSEIKNLEKKLSTYIIGQVEAIKAVSDAIKQTKTKLSNPERPLGSFIFLGPTGVGKTHLAKMLARLVFGSERKLIKIDMSEFMERHNISRLLGAPPGYVGYDEAGKLTEAVRNNPYSVILLDEIEKAHPDVFNILLQIMEDGYLTDARGRRVNFRNTIIIMTSNIGVSQLNKEAVLGFTTKSSKNNYYNIKTKILEEIKKIFKPEFLNRIDNVIIFKPLDKKSIGKIVNLELLELSRKLNLLGIKFTYSKKMIDFMAQKSYKPEFGAREVRRSINKYLTKIISEGLLNKKKITKIIAKIHAKKIKFSYL